MKKIRKRHLSFAPKNRNRKKTGKNYTIDNVCEFLTRFLNDEFIVLNDVEKNPLDIIKKKSRKQKKNKIKPIREKKNEAKPNQNITNYFDGFDETQSLILSAAIIGIRVIRKICKGKNPHWHRVQIWEKGLKIVESFEKQGLLNEKKICYFTLDKYIFRCRVYEADGLGEIILPEKAFMSCWSPETVGDYTRPPKRHPQMPPLMGNTGGILKKQAAKMIS